MKQALAILRFLRDCQARGERTVLVTLTDVTGSAARAPGEHMAVAEGGAVIGSFSGGCVEAAVIAEAREVLASRAARLIRYGAGSPYIDIRLPCGGGIDLLVLPEPDPGQVERALDILEARRPVMLHMSGDGRLMAGETRDTDATGWRDGVFRARHDPGLRLVVMGHGAEPGALLRIARAYGAETLLLSPQGSLVEEVGRVGFSAHLLRIVGRSEYLSVDPFTAVVALFHDHDWEIDLLLQALEQQPLFVGAMGSRRTHAERRRRLLEAGGYPSLVERVVGPIGLIAATRDPQTLAVSIMAQIVQVYEAAIASNARGSTTCKMNDTHHFVETCARSDTAARALHSSSGIAVTPIHGRRRVVGEEGNEVHAGHVGI